MTVSCVAIDTPQEDLKNNAPKDSLGRIAESCFMNKNDRLHTEPFKC